MPQNISRPIGKEENKVCVCTAKSLLQTLLVILRPTQYHSTGLWSNTHVQTSLWAATPSQQLPMLGRQHLLTGSSTEGHCPRTGALGRTVQGVFALHLSNALPGSCSCLPMMIGGGRNCSEWRAESLLLSDLVCLNISAIF